MSTKAMLAAAAMAIAAITPAGAMTLTDAPRNADGSSRFSDPDAAFDAQRDAYQNGRWGGFAFGVDGLARRSGAHAAREGGAALRDPRDLRCVQCTSVLIDGLWVLQPDDRAAYADPAPAR